MDLQRTLSRDRSDDRLMREEREQERRWKRTPKMLPMKTTEDLELYLHDFAHYMERLKIPPEEWMDNLVPLLPEKYRSVLHTMDTTDRDNFWLVRPFLLESVEREGGSLQYKFAGMVRRRGQPYSEFIGQQMRRWEQFTAGRSMREVGNLLCTELAEVKLPNACRLHVKQHQPLKWRTWWKSSFAIGTAPWMIHVGGRREVLTKPNHSEDETMTVPGHTRNHFP